VTEGIVVFAHGSRVEAANQAVRAVTAQLAELGSFRYVEAAFLELGEPSLSGAVARLVGEGVRSIRVIPYFLISGTHMERDLPRILQEISLQYKDLDIATTLPLDTHPALLQILLDRARGPQ
jgi:sirohydrochlorin ferrochelatase